MTVVFFDLETGGLEDHHPNIQLAAVAVDETWDEVSNFEGKIAFNERDAEPEALRLNSYDPVLWKGAGSEKEVIRDFCFWLESFRDVKKVSKRTGNPYWVARLAGHNVATFDHPRILRAAGADGRFFPACFHVLDTLQLARWYFHARQSWPESLSLAALCEHFGIETDDLHDALSDVRATIQLARVLTKGEN